MEAIYGEVPPSLAAPRKDAVVYSPFVPGTEALEDARALSGMTLLAPPGTLERQYVLAAALQALKVGAPLVAMAPKDKGGSRLAKELAAFGCAVQEESRKHYRICTTTRPADVRDIAEACAAGGLQYMEKIGLWSQPGIFSWDRVDPGSALLLAHLPALSGRGLDMGCGTGYLARAVLDAPGVTALALIDLDRRAIEAAKRNVVDARATFLWADVRDCALPGGVDFVVMNPPFHAQGTEDRGLGQRFIERAAQSLRAGGTCWLVANRHLPYEETLRAHFATVTPRAAADGFKILEAVR